MAPWRVGFGAVFLAPKMRFMVATVVLRAFAVRDSCAGGWTER